MMDPLEVNAFLHDDGSNYEYDLDKVAIDVGFEQADFSLDNVEIDKLLTDESKGLEFGMDLNDDDLNLILSNDEPFISGFLEGGTGESMDVLTDLPINEVDEREAMRLLRDLQPPAPTNMTVSDLQYQQARNVNAHDALLGHRGSINNGNDNLGMFQQYQRPNMQYSPQGTGRPIQQAQVNMLPIDGVDLENEKMKLLNRLNEINQRQQNSNNHMGMSTQSKNMFLQPSNLMQKPNPSPFTAGVASVGGLGGGSGETPLTSFLRKGGQKPAASASVISNHFPGAPQAASIFSESPMEFDNPLLLPKQKSTKLYSAMDRSSLSRELVSSMSARGLMARTDSGRNLSGGSFKTSGILPKHVSETHLSRVAMGGLVRSRSKLGSLSRENSLYNLMKKSSSRESFHREDSYGQLPVKRRGPSVASAKHKLGISRSVPHLMHANNRGGDPSTTTGYQTNAQW